MGHRSLGVDVAKEELALQPQLDPCGGPGDLSSHEGFATARALVIEEDAAGGMEPVALAIVDRDPVAVELRHAAWASQIERREPGLVAEDQVLDRLGAERT